MSGVSGTSIPDSQRKTIQDIKEVTGNKHSDEDVYAVLKECNMDPNETAQKLLYLDTFQEVKRKRDRRNVTVSNRASNEYRRAPGMQRRGTRNGNHYPSNNSDGAAGGKHARQEKNHSRLLQDETNKRPVILSSTPRANGSSSTFNGRSNSESSSSRLIEDNAKDTTKDTKSDYLDKSRNLPSLRPVVLKQLTTSDPGPTPTPTPTNTPIIPTRARIQGGISNPKSSRIGSSVASPTGSGMYSSASDPVLVPSLNPRNPGAVGIIKRETGNQRNATKIGNAKRRMNGAQNVSPGQRGSGSVESTSSTQPIEFKGTERNQVDKQKTSSSQQIHDPSKEILFEAANAALEANQGSNDTLEGTFSEQTTADVDIKLHNLRISPRKSVIFPNHLHVPEAFKNAITFGSLDTSLEESNKDHNSIDASVPTNVEASSEPSLIPHSSPPISGHGDYSDRPKSPQNVLVLSPSSENVSSADLRCDQSKHAKLQPVGESHKSILSAMPDCGLSLIPPVVGSHPVQPEAHEPQGGNSLVSSKTGSTPSMTQPRGIAQSSIPVSPHLLPYIRQPYPPNYIPYSPYFSQIYMPPQNAQHMLSPTLFPQQPSTGNMYMPPTAAAAAASGVKFPVYKPGNVAGNPTHFGISPGYGPYGASGLAGYGSAALRQGTSSNDDDDIATSELKEKNLYSSIKQNEDLRTLTSASGRDTSASPANVLYNIYHPSQNMSTLHHSQTVEPIVPPLSSYPQSQFQRQPHLLPLTQQQYGQMNWNKKLTNRENV